MTMAINALRPELPGFVSSFNKDADVLSKLLDAEVFATILQIKEEINDANSMIGSISNCQITLFLLIFVFF